MRRELIPARRRAARAARAAGRYGIDGPFWASRRHMANGTQTCIGIKGLPGTPGLGIGHRPKSKPGRQWRPDPEMKILRQLIGDDAENYL